ncbi:ankyrin repeat domain-containing protein 26 isoform X5 [Oryctolagus cuniculus]|uniref:ankyrin repeat domain-containing protein 26 isoform X5 n=1 Tax=Oryctolagus cuniculus TaxID=9986 RepID=UPI003879CDC9
MEKFFSWSVRKFERKPAWTVTEFEKKHLKRRPHFGYRLLYWELGAIHRAASAGNVAAVEKILGCRRSGVDDVDHKSRTALHWACAKGHQDMVAFLISRRCLLDPQDKRAATPLIKAVQCPAENCATLLLDHGADPNIEDEIGNTALHYAAYGGNTRMAEKLLSSNADIEKKNETGLTPLLVAIQQNQESMVKFLILQNADVFAIDNLHRTSLMFAGWYNTEDIVHMLLELGVDVLSEDIAGHSARDYALQKRNMQNYQLISLFQENAVLENIVNTNPEDEHSKEYRKRLLEIPDVNHELLISYEEGLNSFAKKDLIIPGRTTAIIHSAPEEQPNNDRITRVHGVHEDNKCGSEDEAKESTLDPEEGTSTLAGKKSKKRFFITQVAPQQPINKYGMDSDHGLDKDNKRNKESTSQRDPEDSKSQKNSKEGTSTLAGKKSKKRFFITQVAPQQPIMNSDHGLDKDNKCNKESTSQRDPEDSKSQKNSKEGTSTLAGKKSKKRFFITQVAPQQPIMNSDHGLDKDNKRNKESTSQRDPEDSKSQKNSKEGTSTLAGKKSKKRFFITQVAPQQPIMNSDHGLDKDNKCNKESTSQRDPEDSKSQKNSKEGMSTVASKKGLKDIAITQVAPHQPVNKYAFNYDRGLDNDKESASQRDPEDSKSQKNSKEESSAEPLKREEVAVPISGISDEAVESPWDSEEETSSGKGEVRAGTGGVPEGDILDYFLSCSWARIAKERKASMASSGDTEKDVAVSLSAQEHAKDTLSGIAGVPEDKTIDMPGFRPDDEPLKYSLKSEEGMSTVASKKGLKDIAITQVAPHQPVNKYAFNYDRGLDNGNMDKESTSQRDPEDSKSQKNSKTISTNSWKKSINQSMAADAKRKDMNEPLEEFAKGSTELTPRLEAIHPFWTTSVGMNEVQTCRQDNDIKTTNKEEQEWLDGSKNKQFEEKGQRCQSKEMEVLRNLHESAAPPDDSDGCGLNQQRQSGDLDNQQSATKKNEEYYFCPALHIKETKNENEKVTSMEYGIRPVIENGFSLTRSLLQVIYDNNLSELDRLKREQLRRKEKQYHKEVEVKQLEVTHRTLELDARTSKNNLTQFQESEDEQKELVQNTEKIQDHLEKHDQENHELKDTILKQAREIKNLQEILFRLSSVDMKHLQQQQDDIEKRQCKSEASLREMAQFYLKLNSKMQDIMNKLDEIIRKFQVSENLHQGVVENVKKTQDYLEHYNSRLQSEILEMKDIVKLHAGSIEELQKNLIRPSSVDVKHLQQQHDELQQRQSKSEASLEDMACFYYKLNNKTKDIMDELGEINRKFQEAAALHQEEVQNARKLQDHLEHYNARLKYENSVLKDTIKVQANRIEEQQKYLIRPSSFKDEQQHILLLAELNQALQDKLDEEMKKNGDLGDKITQPALCCGPGVQWRMAQVLGPCTPGETRRSAWLLPSDQHGAPATVRQPRRPLEGEPTKKTSCQKSSEYLMESDDISKSIQKEHRIHVGISTLSKMKAPQEAISKELDEYKQLLLEGFEDLRRKQDEIIQVAKAFSKQVNEVNEVLAEVRTKNFLLEKQQTGTLTKSVTTQTSVASHSVGNCANSFWLSRDLTPQQNLETPTSATQASHHNTAESLDTFALQDLDTSTSWGRSFQNTEQYRSQQNFFFMPE